MSLVAVAQSQQNLLRFLFGGFPHHDRLEPAFQCGILLDILAVFGDGGRADHLKTAARQHRFENVGGVSRAFGGTGSDQGVDFVNKENHIAVLHDFVNHRLNAFLKFTAVLGTGDHAGQTEIDNTLVFERFGHLSLGDFQRQTFRNGSLADARFTDQTGVVLGAAGQNLYHAVNLLLTSDDRVNFALLGFSGQISAVLVEILAALAMFAAALCSKGILSAHAAQHTEQSSHGRLSAHVFFLIIVLSAAPECFQCVDDIRNIAVQFLNQAHGVTFAVVDECAQNMLCTHITAHAGSDAFCLLQRVLAAGGEVVGVDGAFHPLTVNFDDLVSHIVRVNAVFIENGLCHR